LQVTIYISAYVEAANRDAFMAVKQDLLLAFIDCCNRNGAKLARKRTQVSQTCFCSLLLV
jgi:mechanosensitive ion channel protein 1/2/3